ncbi:hypothetical protein COX67_02200 [Candidatus Falkowbacteria bacterium CG_4_10_14_0_2_um_filter_36_22]|uniref:Aminoglycoside phosphotransferase domain-containing protein n=2 Tax=Candidatus Falkowiibacteriota TaxID=1752728 RepID=A0A1J4T4S2_9BACT|nr:MAG: hypothetical protein AUJ27_04110 [Candidatus Falkowbacteria bacterium CG1_02_37_44]PIV50773.1 MAG: hypothetical protein COS18_04025 [Candidatus Falkowbacteria bacterium CG02_land_8_20_14_3_00_36_14]PIX12167.1 MAG: hypothetical protein COZ73_00840 [Candidatus Falkowbacteria bacterium CG_4_8_14_3_um_filter_36_11]PJA10987.1 MAG: hypothetical protein COX67_02200 [Candidatus Falkowbacteria bacterium CG_4_10_14_0_2_um_filter_36_22]
MKIKVLGNKFIRDTKFSILKVGRYVIKIPFSFAALREAKTEAENVQEAEKDLFFSLFLPPYKYFSVIKVIPYLSLFTDNPSWQNLIENYFAAAFKDSKLWEKKRIKDLSDFRYFLRFIKEYDFESYNWWENYLDNLKISSSSAHGDFHIDNILTENNKLFFIDWARYRPLSSRYFDLMEFYIFSKKKEKESWMNAWQEEFGLSEIFKININRSHWNAYGIWKTAEELKTIYLRKGLYKYKCKKYIEFIEKFKEIIV